MFNVTDWSMFCRLTSSTIPRLSCRLLGTVSRPAEVAASLLPPEEESPLVLDLTLGTGTTSSHLLETTKARLVGVDVDPGTSLTVTRLTETYQDRFTGVTCSWSSLPARLQGEDLAQCDLVMMELGPSTAQLEEGRGFTSTDPGPLDMRFSRSGILCSDLLRLGEMDQLVKVLKVYGGVTKAKAIVSDIVEKRYLLEDINTAPDLLRVLTECHHKDFFWRDKDEMTVRENIERVFTACRMFINNEINELFFAIRMAEKVLRKDGFLVIDAKSEHEKNLITKYLFRDSGTVRSGENETFSNIWEQQSQQFVFKKISK